MDSRYEEKQSNSTRNMKHVNFVPKDVQRILSSHKSIMNRKCSTRKLFLKISQYSQENTCVGISFLIKIQAFRAPALLKRDSNTGVFCEHWEIFKNTYFEEHLRTAASEIFTWTFFYMNKQHRKWRRCFLKNKTKQKPIENSAILKKLAFSWCSLSVRFSLFLHFTSDGIYLPW